MEQTSLTDNEPESKQERHGIVEQIMQELHHNNIYSYTSFDKDMLLSKEELREKKGQLFFDSETSTPMVNMSYGGNRPPMLGGQNTRWITFNIRQIDMLTRSNPHIRNAIDYLATIPLMNGIDINSPEDKISSQEMFSINQKFDSLYKSLKDILSKHYAYGGAAGLIWLSNELTSDLKEPLILSKVKKNSFMGLKTLARWYSIEPALEKGMITYVGDNNGLYNAEYVGTPEYYWVNLVGGLYGLDNTISKNNGRILVHASRLLVFSTETPSVIETQIERFWGPALIETMYNDIINDRRLWNATLKSADKNNMGLLKIDGLGVAAMTNINGKKKLTDRLSLIKEASSNNILPIDIKDDFQFASAVLTGQAEVIGINHSRLAGSAGVPINVMFPDNENDKNENIPVKSIVKGKTTQEVLLRPAYERLLPIIIKSELGKQIRDVAFTFNPIETLTLKDKTEMFLNLTEGLMNLYEVGADKVSIFAMLDDAGKDPYNIAQNLNSKFREHLIEKSNKGEFETKNSDQILVAKTLNQQNLAGVHNPESDLGGEQGGNKKSTKKPLERYALNRGKAKL